jgi:integrase
VLKPIWNEKPETASRLRQRIEAVLDYAVAMGVRTGDNPARWRGHLDHLLPKPSKVRAVKHHAAMAYSDVPEFMVSLAQRDGISARALAFSVLTVARSGETREMRWAEIDLDNRMWIIPSERMKAAKEHRVPLSNQAIALLGAYGGDDDLVFGSDTKIGKPISDMSMTAVLRRMKLDGITVHGFRSSFRDWAGETTHFPREVIEAALAHRLKDKAEAAYARGDLFDKRRELMAAWAEYICNEKISNTHLYVV